MENLVRSTMIHNFLMDHRLYLSIAETINLIVIGSTKWKKVVIRDSIGGELRIIIEIRD